MPVKEQEDHDLLIRVANDVTWMKWAMCLLNVPVVTACIKFLFTAPS